MARLTAGVVLRNPETGQPEFLAEGSDLPRWAAGLVGDHALEQPKAPAKKAAAKPE